MVDIGSKWAIILTLLTTCPGIRVKVFIMAGKLRDVMNIDELGDYLRLPKPTVYKLAQNGKIPGKKAGKQWRFHKAAIDRWLSERYDEQGHRPGRGS